MSKFVHLCCTFSHFFAAGMTAVQCAGLSYGSGMGAGGLGFVLPGFIVRRMGEIIGNVAGAASCWRQRRWGGADWGGLDGGCWAESQRILSGKDAERIGQRCGGGAPIPGPKNGSRGKPLITKGKLPQGVPFQNLWLAELLHAANGNESPLEGGLSFVQDSLDR